MGQPLHAHLGHVVAAEVGVEGAWLRLGSGSGSGLGLGLGLELGPGVKPGWGLGLELWLGSELGLVLVVEAGVERAGEL